MHPLEAGPGSAGTDTSGTNNPNGQGILRGMFDYSTLQVSSIQSTTDGTSNTYLLGERIALQGSAGSMWA